MLDVAGVSALALGVATAVYRGKRHNTAVAHIKKLEASMKARVDVKKEVKKHKKQLGGIPLIVVTDQREYETLIKPKVKTLGFEPAEVASILKTARSVMKEVMSGNNAYVWTVHGSKKRAVFLVTPPKLSKLAFMHELGHIQSMKAGTSIARLDMGDIQRTFYTAMDTLSGIYSKYGRYGSYREEQRAWDLAGVPPGNPLRKAALASYKHGAKLDRLIIKMGAAALAFPVARILLAKKGSVDIPTPKFMKEDVGLIRAGLPAGIPGQMVEYT